MKRGMLCAWLAVVLAMNLSVETSYSLTIRGYDPSARSAETRVILLDGETVTLKEGEERTFVGEGEFVVIRRAESNWSRTPVQPERKIRIFLRRTDAVKPEFMVSLMAMIQRRRILLNYPPASSVWHLPAGLSILTSMLRQDGHEVVQRYGHIIGLEYVLKEHGGESVERALTAIRNSHSNINVLCEARTTLERVSRNITAQGKFEVARNNVSYVSSYYDGSIERVLEAVRNRGQHLWYDYFAKVELPLARDFKPDLYGISIADERQLIQGLILASMVKDEFPDCLVVLGGNFWSRVTGAFRLPEFAQFFNHCDAIAYREGFQPFQQLAETLNPAHASGVAWRSDGKVVVNSATQSPTDFETLPTPAFDGGARQWAPDFVPSLYTMSNCPMACGFCAISAGSDSFLGKPRAMSPRRVAEHMAALGAHRFDIFDETFPIQRQVAVGRELKRIGHPATWQCYLTITDSLLDGTKCAELYEAGCRAVQLGLETLSPETLHRENKKWNSPENYGRILRNLRLAGIQTHVFLIVGFPGEPLKHGLQWIPFLEEHGDSILTIKAGRYRLCRESPEERGGTHSRFIKVMPDNKPLSLNRNFQYIDQAMSRKRVEAVRDVLEQACRDHWAYSVTSTLPWWVNRGRYSWDELRAMANQLGHEPPVPHIERSLKKVEGIS